MPLKYFYLILLCLALSFLFYWYRVGSPSYKSNKVKELISLIKEERERMYKAGFRDGTMMLYTFTGSYFKAEEICNENEMRLIDLELGPPHYKNYHKIKLEVEKEKKILKSMPKDNWIEKKKSQMVKELDIIYERSSKQYEKKNMSQETDAYKILNILCSEKEWELICNEIYDKPK